jgi:hypothetical protein
LKDFEPCGMPASGLGCVKTQRRANCREKYSFVSIALGA